MTACASSLIGHYRMNLAQYTGAGTVSVCERADSSTYGNLSRVCKNNSAQSDADLFTAWDYNWWVTLKVGNNSANNHTIHGHGYNP